MSALQNSKAAIKRRQKNVEVYINLCCYEKKRVSQFSGDKDTTWHVYVAVHYFVLH